MRGMRENKLFSKVHALGLLVCCTLALGACGDSGSNVASTTSPAGTSGASGSGTSGSGGGGSSVASVELAGTPATTATAGVAYSFQPTLAQGGGTVIFSITGAPSWATFNTSTGALTGTPSTADEGTSASIRISASNGTSNASLAPFTIQVNAPTPTTGSASLSWTAPTTNIDGTEVTDLAGYHVYYGQNASSLQQTITINTPTVTSLVVDGLSSGTYYFTVVAYNSMGVDSADSNIVSKTI